MKNFKGCNSALQTYQKCKMYIAKCKLSGEYDKGCHQLPLRGYSKQFSQVQNPSIGLSLPTNYLISSVQCLRSLKCRFRIIKCKTFKFKTLLP